MKGIPYTFGDNPTYGPSDARLGEMKESRQVMEIISCLLLLVLNCIVYWGLYGLWLIKKIIGVKTFGLKLWSCIIVKIGLGLGLGTLTVAVIFFGTILMIGLIARLFKVI